MNADLWALKKNWSDLEIQDRLCGNLSSQVDSQSEIEFICKFLNLFLSISNVCESKILHAPQETCYRNAQLWVLPYYVPILRDPAYFWLWVGTLLLTLGTILSWISFVSKYHVSTILLNCTPGLFYLIISHFWVWLVQISKVQQGEMPKQQTFSVSSNFRIRLFDLCQIITTTLGLPLGGDHFLVTYWLQMPRERVLIVTLTIQVW